MNRCFRSLATLTAIALLQTAVAGQDITSNLRGHWKLIETAGTTATDSSTIINHGVYTNGVTLANSSPVPSDGAVAARFDGADDYVAMPNEALYDVVGVFTVAVWIKVNAFSVPDQAIITKGETASARLIRDGSTNGVAFVCRGLTTIRVASTTSVNDGNWHHVVGVFTSSQLRLYIDGVLNNSVASFGFISTNNFPLHIGGNSEVAGRNFNGWLYDARLYDRALSAADVLRLYLQNSPAGHWKFNEGTGTVVSDSSLRAGHAAFSSGAPTWISGVRGGALQFDGVDDAADTNANFTPPSTGTVAFWFLSDGAPIGRERLFGVGGDWEAWQDPDGLVRFDLCCDGNTTGFHTATSCLEVGRWYHLAAVFDQAAGTYRVYVDGKLDKSGTVTLTTQAADLLTFGTRTGSTERFSGALDDFQVYDRTLSASEVAQLYGLVGHWTFAEGVGTSAADSSGLANNATLSGGATWETDCAGNKALQTNGIGGNAQTAAAFKPPSEGTVAFWMRGAGIPATRGRLMGVNGEWEIRQEPTGALSFDLGASPFIGNEPFSTLDPVAENGRWYHIAAVFNDADNSYKVYIDGQLQTSGISAVDLVPQTAAVLSFGMRAGSTEYWLGALRDFRVYNRQLSSREIAGLYSLVGYWKFDETSGAMAADSSGFGRSGSVIGTPSWSIGAIDNGLALNGATRAEVSSLLGSPRNVTLAAWARLTTADSAGAEIISLGDYFAIRLDEGTISRAFFYNGSTWISVQINQTFAGKGWHHFTAVFNDDQNVCKLYLDGAEVASVSTTVTIPYTGLGTKTVVGAHGNGLTTRDFTGKIDDVRVYSRALCASEVVSLLNGGDPFEGVRIIKWVEIQ